jgi:hypothetical protein
MYNKTLPTEISHNTGNPGAVITMGFDLLTFAFLQYWLISQCTAYTIGSMFHRLQFQCNDGSVTFVFPEIIWTESEAHQISSLLPSPVQSDKHHEADRSHLSSEENNKHMHLHLHSPTFTFTLKVSQLQS